MGETCKWMSESSSTYWSQISWRLWMKSQRKFSSILVLVGAFTSSFIIYELCNVWQNYERSCRSGCVQVTNLIDWQIKGLTIYTVNENPLHRFHKNDIWNSAFRVHPSTSAIGFIPSLICPDTVVLKRNNMKYFNSPSV